LHNIINFKGCFLINNKLEFTVILLSINYKKYSKIYYNNICSLWWRKCVLLNKESCRQTFLPDGLCNEEISILSGIQVRKRKIKMYFQRRLSLEYSFKPLPDRFNLNSSPPPQVRAFTLFNPFLHIHAFMAWANSVDPDQLECTCHLNRLCTVCFYFMMLFLTKKRPVQILLRWHGCAGWSGSTLVAHE
jgi:hypothetical protein